MFIVWDKTSLKWRSQISCLIECKHLDRVSECPTLLDQEIVTTADYKIKTFKKLKAIIYFLVKRVGILFFSNGSSKVCFLSLPKHHLHTILKRLLKECQAPSDL